MDYNICVESVPEEILTISFVLSVLPAVWIFDAELSVAKIDKTFWESINEFKEGFINMYPTLLFKGKINVEQIIDAGYDRSDRVGSFFSGGVDATATLLSHIDEKPLLFNIHGSDISVNDSLAIQQVEYNINDMASRLNLDVVYVTSTFKDIVNRKSIDAYLKSIVKDTYWHGFQHGLAIIGHAAPIAWIYKLKRMYIAASFTKDEKFTCASDPTIDNYVRLSSAEICHDGYEYNRIDKHKIIKQFHEKTGIDINLRVCFDEHRPDNCCGCENVTEQSIHY